MNSCIGFSCSSGIQIKKNHSKALYKIFRVFFSEILSEILIIAEKIVYKNHLWFFSREISSEIPPGIPQQFIGRFKQDSVSVSAT